MDKLNMTKATGDTLTAAEFNSVTAKVDELVDNTATVDDALAGKAAAKHSHESNDITDLVLNGGDVTEGNQSAVGANAVWETVQQYASLSDLSSQTAKGAAMVGYKGVKVILPTSDPSTGETQFAKHKTVEAELDDLHTKAYTNERNISLLKANSSAKAANVSVEGFTTSGGTQVAAQTGQEAFQDLYDDVEGKAAAKHSHTSSEISDALDDLEYAVDNATNQGKLPTAKAVIDYVTAETAPDMLNVSYTDASGETADTELQGAIYGITERLAALEKSRITYEEVKE